MTRQAPRPVAVVVAAAMVASIGLAWLPWIETGDTRRNSYEMFRSAQRLGLEQLTPIRVLWFLMPVIAGAAILAGLVGFRRVTGLLSILVGLVVGLVGFIVALSDAAVAVAPSLAAMVGVAAIGSGGFLLRNSQGPVPV